MKLNALLMVQLPLPDLLGWGCVILINLNATPSHNHAVDSKSDWFILL